MSRKIRTTEEDYAWHDQILAGVDLDPDQQLVREMYETIDRALQNDLDMLRRIEGNLADEKRNGLPVDLGTVEHVVKKIAQVIAARDGVFALLAARAHPIHRFVDITRRKFVNGRYSPSLGESHFRSLVTAFVKTVPKKIPQFNARKAAKLAADIIAELGLGNITPASIIAWESREGSYGLLGQDGVTMYVSRLENIPADDLDRSFRAMLAELRGGDAVGLALETSRKHPPSGK